MDLQEQQKRVSGGSGGSGEECNMKQKRPVCFFVFCFFEFHSQQQTRAAARDISSPHDSPANLLMAVLFHTAP